MTCAYSVCSGCMHTPQHMQRSRTRCTASPPVSQTSSCVCVCVCVFITDNTEFRRRVVAAVGLLVTAKLLNISVPLFFKAAVDAMTVPGAAGAVAGAVVGGGGLGWWAGPSAMIAAYGAAKAGTALCNEARNMVFAKVWTLLDLYTHTHTHTHRRAHTHIHTHTHTHTHTKTHICARSLVRERSSAMFFIPVSSCVTCAVHTHTQVTQGAIRRVAREVFVHLQSLDLSYHLSKQTGTEHTHIHMREQGPNPPVLFGPRAVSLYPCVCVCVCVCVRRRSLACY